MLTREFPAVMNYTEMEAKVREATNNEPWVCASVYCLGCPLRYDWGFIYYFIHGMLTFWQGASSSLMQEIANGTYN